MANSIGYTQRHYQEKQDINAEKLGNHFISTHKTVNVVLGKWLEKLKITLLGSRNVMELW